MQSWHICNKKNATPTPTHRHTPPPPPNTHTHTCLAQRSSWGCSRVQHTQWMGWWPWWSGCRSVHWPHPHVTWHWPPRTPLLADTTAALTTAPPGDHLGSAPLLCWSWKRTKTHQHSTPLPAHSTALLKLKEDKNTSTLYAPSCRPHCWVRYEMLKQGNSLFSTQEGNWLLMPR